MGTLVVEIQNVRVFQKTKDSLNPFCMVDCGVCGAVKVETKELANTLEKLSAEIQSLNDAEAEEGDLYSDLLAIVVEPEPDFETFDELMKWRGSNTERLCGTFEFGEMILRGYSRYDEVILLTDPDCNCFASDKSRGERVKFDAGNAD